MKPRFGRRWRGSEAGRHEGGKYLARTSRKGKPTSGLGPLICSLRVINQVLQEFAQTYKLRISKPVHFFALPCFAPYCVADGARVVSMTRSYPLRLRVISSQYPFVTPEVVLASGH